MYLANSTVNPKIAYRLDAADKINLSRVNPVTGKVAAHNGIDIQLNNGDSVYSAGKGTISDLGTSATAGNFIIVKHDDGKQSKYFHLKDNQPLNKGARVLPGTKIGTGDSTGRVTGPHLHFELRASPGGAVLDPEQVLNGCF